VLGNPGDVEPVGEGLPELALAKEIDNVH